jgi:hypothetical protein
MISLSDEQLKQVMELARPLAPWQRDQFLRAVARNLDGVEVGDDTVHSAAIAAQREVINGAARRA